MSRIPPLDLTEQYRLIEPEIRAVVTEVLASGQYIGGFQVEAFEQALGKYLNCPEVIGCNSGTDALYLALRALEIGPGDEVITTPFTFFATTEVISALGAVPVFVDIDPVTFNLDLSQLEGAMTPKTRAIVPVHLFGHPVDMTQLQKIAQAYHLPVVEDCAQAIGAEWAGRKVGTWGTIGCFSFFPTKNLGACGDGGAVVTADADLAARMRVLKNHGSAHRYYHEAIGINSRLDALQAAILRIKLSYLDRWNQQRRVVADRYHKRLQSVPGLVLPQGSIGGTSVWHQYTVRIQPCGKTLRCGDHPCGKGEKPLPEHCQARAWVKAQLEHQGITTMIYYPVPLHLQTVYQSLGYGLGQFPVAEQMAQEVLSLPMFPELTEVQQDHIRDALVMRS